MRRFWLVIASASLVVIVGCGRKNYDERLTKSLEKMKYDQSLKRSLMEAPTDKKWTELNIYVRPPKEEALAKTGQLPVGEGQFDLDASFVDKTDSSLHILARVKKAKKTPAKGAPPVATPAAVRGAFDQDVVNVISSSVYAPTEQLSLKFVDEPERGNRYKRIIYSSGENEVKLYMYKQEAYEVALVFVYNVKKKTEMNAKIRLCLGSFATGQRAQFLLQGGRPDEEPESGPAGPL